MVVEYNPPHAFVEPLADFVVEQLASPAVARENLNRFKAMVEEQAAALEKRQEVPASC